MRTPIENIKREWKALIKLRGRVEDDYQKWTELEDKVRKVFNDLNREIGWKSVINETNDLPNHREIRLVIPHIFPLDEELVGYTNEAAISIEQRLSGQIFIWYFFPQKEHFTEIEGPTAIAAGQYRIDQLLQDEKLLLFRVETFLNELKGWMLEVFPEPAEERKI